MDLNLQPKTERPDLDTEPDLDGSSEHSGRSVDTTVWVSSSRFLQPRTNTNSGSAPLISKASFFFCTVKFQKSFPFQDSETVSSHCE